MNCLNLYQISSELQDAGRRVSAEQLQDFSFICEELAVAGVDMHRYPALHPVIEDNSIEQHVFAVKCERFRQAFAEFAKVMKEQEAQRVAGSLAWGRESPSTSAQNCCAREQTSRELLQNLCAETRFDLDGLQDLLKALPQELPYRADRALRRLIQK